MNSLTAGAIARLARSDQSMGVDPTFTPIVQILKVLPLTGTGNQQQRFRCILSDGSHFIQGMFASQNNHLVINNSIKDLTLIRVRDCMCNIVQNKRLLIILSLDIIQCDVPNKIGNPVDYGGIDSNNNANAAPHVIPQYPAPSNNAAAAVATSMYNHTSTNVYGGMNNTITGGVHVKPSSYMANSTSNNMMGSLPSNHNNNPYGTTMNTHHNPPPYTSSSSHHNPNLPAAAPNHMYNRNNNSSTTAASSSSSMAMPSIVRSNVMQQHFTPINQLNQYQNRWTIKARVTSKSDVRTWSNAKGEGKLFSIELADSSGCDIRATFFKEAVDQFEPLLQVDRVYTFSGGKLKAANLQYNTCKSNFEITFDQNAAIAMAEDDVPTQGLYNFVSIQSLEGIDVGGNVDLLAIVKQVSPPSTIVSKKSGQEMFKSDIVLVDESNCEITCTLWGERAQRAEMQLSGHPVVAFRRLRLSEYGGRSLSVSGSSVMTIQPTNLPEADRLRMWWHQGGANQGGGSRSLSVVMGGGASRFPTFEERKTISSIRGESLGLNPEKADWISFTATFTFIKSDKDGGPWYTACPNANEPCKNRYKVTASADGGYHCDRCNQTYPNCMRKYIFSATISDDTCTSWISVFDDQARVMLKEVTADALYGELENGNQGAFDAVFTRANFTEWVMTCKVKQEMANDEMKLKTSLMALHPIDYAKEGRSVLKGILKL